MGVYKDFSNQKLKFSALLVSDPTIFLPVSMLRLLNEAAGH